LGIAYVSGRRLAIGTKSRWPDRPSVAAGLAVGSRGGQSSPMLPGFRGIAKTGPPELGKWRSCRNATLLPNNRFRCHINLVKGSLIGPDHGVYQTDRLTEAARPEHFLQKMQPVEEHVRQ
jgi:hypothetical protein